MQFSFDLIFGLPGAGLEGFKRGLEWVLSYRPFHLFAYHCMVLPGSELERQAKELGLIYQKEPPHLMVETPAMSREDFGAARRLGVLVHFLGCNQAIYNELYGLMDRHPGEGGRVATLERWGRFLAAAGLDLCPEDAGWESGETTSLELAGCALRRIEKDPLLLAAVMKATRDFAARELGGASSASRPTGTVLSRA